MRSLLKIDGWLIFLLFCLVLCLFVFVNNEFIVTEQLYDEYVESVRQEKYNDYDEVAAEFQEDLEEDVDDSRWYDNLFDFGFVVLQSTVQFGLIAAFIFVGLLLRHKGEEISYPVVFKVVMVSEFVFFIPKAIKYLWFLLQHGEYSFEDVKDFNAFSLYGLLKPYEISDWLIYPLKFVNIFEVLYIIVLIIGIATVARVRFSQVAVMVSMSYLSLMLLWIILRVYLSTLF